MPVCAQGPSHILFPLPWMLYPLVPEKPSLAIFTRAHLPFILNIKHFLVLFPAPASICNWALSYLLYWGLSLPLKCKLWEVFLFPAVSPPSRKGLHRASAQCIICQLSECWWKAFFCSALLWEWSLWHEIKKSGIDEAANRIQRFLPGAQPNSSNIIPGSPST